MGAVNILENVTRERLLTAVPHVYRTVCDVARLADYEYTVVVFPSDKTVMSAVVSKALAKLPETAKVIALARNLTQEGLAMLVDREAIVFLLRGGFYWTDESLRSVA